MSTPVMVRRAELTEEELDQARLFLQQTLNCAVGATKGLSQAQWRFQPSPGQWSIAENLDHIVSVQERVLGPILGGLANAPAPAADVDYKLVDAIVIHHFSTRLAKFTAPESMRPANQIDPPELLRRLRKNHEELSGCLESMPGLRDHALPSPPLKAVSKGVYETMDGYQWILAAAAHTERHAKQMLEVKADEGYPA